MAWLGAGIDGPLIAVRAIHFAATAMVAGTLVFRAVVAKPALPSEQADANLLRRQTLAVAWIALTITVASGLIWLLLLAATMSSRLFGEAMTSDVLQTVLNQTQFGMVFEIRIVL